jgi:uncharacterized protein (TIGR00251 family)
MRPTDAELQSCERGGVILPVKAQPGASRNEIRDTINGMLRVSVTQVAEKGKANKVLRETIAKGLGLRKSQIELVSGHASPQKRFRILDISPSDLMARITSCVARR